MSCDTSSSAVMDLISSDEEAEEQNDEKKVPKDDDEDDFCFVDAQKSKKKLLREGLGQKKNEGEEEEDEEVRQHRAELHRLQNLMAELSREIAWRQQKLEDSQQESQELHKRLTQLLHERQQEKQNRSNRQRYLSSSFSSENGGKGKEGEEKGWHSTSAFPWSKILREVATEYFGVTSFRANQLEAMNSLLANCDTFLVMPTGGGKSLCFQAPTLVEASGLTLVISPLLSLMSDQVMSLKALGIPAALLSSQSSKEEAMTVRSRMKTLQQPPVSSSSGGSYLRFLYITPERIAKSKLFMSSLEKIYSAGQLRFVVIDEVHCVSEWGHAFRPDYQRLSLLKRHFPATPILALTATATSEILRDVRQTLGLSACEEFRSPINRPNIFYEIRPKPKQNSDIAQLIVHFIRKCFPPRASGIIYCATRKDANTVCDDLGMSNNTTTIKKTKAKEKTPSSSVNKRNASSLEGRKSVAEIIDEDEVEGGVRCAVYHGDMTGMERHEVHRKWSLGEVQVVVATVAFGMGINKEDVRFVIHHSLPKSPDLFYQETGRSGRDGQPAHCLLLYRASDVCRHSVMVYWEQMGLPLLYKMVKFCTSQECRRKLLSRHFGDEEAACEGMCDNCAEEKRRERERGKEAEGAVEREGEAEDISLQEKTSRRLKRTDALRDTNKNIITNSSNYRNRGEEFLDDIDLETLREALIVLFAILKSCEGTEVKYTLPQLQAEWKRKWASLVSSSSSSSTSKHLGHTIFLPSNIEGLQQILMNLLVRHFLKEEFFHTPYSTNSYLRLAPKGAAALETLRLQNASSSSSTFSLTKEVAAEFLEGWSWKTTESSRMWGGEGVICLNERRTNSSGLDKDKGRRRGEAEEQEAKEMERKVLAWRNKVSLRLDIYPHFILSEREIEALVDVMHDLRSGGKRKRDESQTEGEGEEGGRQPHEKFVEILGRVLCQKKVEIYGKDLKEIWENFEEQRRAWRRG